MISRLALRFFALGYLAVLLMFPVGFVVYKAFGGGLHAAWAAATTSGALHALYLTLLIGFVAVAANTVFGVITAIIVVRHPFPGVSLFTAMIDLPLAISPVVVGLALILVYARTGWLGPWLMEHGISVVFSLPGMILATIFVTLPFVVREVVPVLREVGAQQEEAAVTLGASSFQTFWRITLPSIRAGVVYGVVLTTARALGEFGAVSVVSGHIAGVTETLTLYVGDQYEAFDLTGAYVGAVVLALLAVLTLVIMNISRKKEIA
jgi:sulfate transport system permease protein